MHVVPPSFGCQAWGESAEGRQEFLSGAAAWRHERGGEDECESRGEHDWREPEREQDWRELERGGTSREESKSEGTTRGERRGHLAGPETLNATREQEGRDYLAAMAAAANYAWVNRSSMTFLVRQVPTPLSGIRCPGRCQAAFDSHDSHAS